MKNFIAPALIALTLSSCSLGEKFGRLKAEEGTTIVQFAKQRSLAAVASAPTLPGGVMVYALRADGFATSLKLDHESDAREFSLPNGEYTFRAVGWSAANLAGTTQCGLGRPTGGVPGGVFRLTGTSTTIPIALTVNACGSAEFSDPAYVAANTFVRPAMVFCNEEAVIAGRAFGSACSNGDESVRFLKGNAASAAPPIEDVALISSAKRFAYRTDLHGSGRQEIFSVDFAGKNAVKESFKLTAGEVKLMAAVPGTDYLLYIATSASSGKDDIYVKKVGTPGTHSLFTTEPANAVKTFTVTKNGRYVVFISDRSGSAGTYDLYSLPLTAATLSASNGFGVASKLSVGGIRWDGTRHIYAISPNDGALPVPQVVYATATSPNKVYTNSLDGALTAKLMSHGTPTNANTVISSVHFIGETPAIAFVGDPEGALKAYYSFLNLGIATPAVISNLGASSDFYASPYLPAVVYSREASSKSTLFSLTFNDVSFVPTGGETVLMQATNNTATFGGVQFHPTTQQITFWANIANATKHEVYTGLLNSTATLRGHSTIGTSMNTLDPEKAVQFGAATELFYLSSDTAAPSQGEVYRADLSAAGPRNAALVSATGNRSLTSMSMQAFPGQAFYTSLSAGSPAYYELYRFTVTGSANTQIPTGAAQNITKLHAPENGWSFPAEYPRPLFLEATAAGATGRSDIFLLNDRNSSSPAISKLTHLYDSADGFGRFRFTVVPYRREAGGALRIAGEGISSGCLGIPNHSSQDAAPLPIHIPYGQGPSPYAVLLELFPEQLNCDGQARKHLIEGGLNTLANVAADAKAALSSGGSPAVVRIFLRD